MNRFEFEKSPVEVQDYSRKITDHSRGIYRRLYLNLKKEHRRMSTCNRLDFPNTNISTGYRLPKNLPDHWSGLSLHTDLVTSSNSMKPAAWSTLKKLSCKYSLFSNTISSQVLTNTLDSFSKLDVWNSR